MDAEFELWAAGRKLIGIVSLGALLAADVRDAGAAEKVVDLSHAYDASTVYWPTEPGFVLERGPAGVTERGYWYAANRFSSPEHGGTHIDAPSHFWREGQSVDAIPLERLLGEGACVDLSVACAADRDYLATVEDLQQWEAAHATRLDDKIVFLRTGYAARWADRARYLGTSATGRDAVSQLHFPGLDPSAAEWLATRRRVRLVAIDTASIDHGPSRDFAAHVTLFRHGVPAIENLASLDELPPTGFRVTALPMKIAGGTGGPCRVVATVEEAKPQAAIGAEPTRPAEDINAAFVDPDVDEFVERFEVESREVFDRRQRIVEACQVQPGETIADIGAGTGLFTRLFSKEVGPAGRVIAVDIAQNFLDHIQQTSRELDQKNVAVLRCTQNSTELPAESIDLAFICDTYHHFEEPQKTMASIHRALKPGGRVILVDYKRIPGESSDWTLNHVRAGQDVFEREIEDAGFRKVGEAKDVLKENYFVEFRKQQ